MDELLNALAVNFEGKEELRQLLLTAPAYGNDDDYIDEIFNAVSWDTGKIATDYHYYSGMPTILFRGGATQHFWAGQVVGAMPRRREKHMSRWLMAFYHRRKVKTSRARRQYYDQRPR